MRALLRSYDLGQPGASAGALHALADAMRQAGHEVLTSSGTTSLAEVRDWTPDLIVAQQWATPEAYAWALALRRPFVMLVHGSGQLEAFMPVCDLVAFATAELRDDAREALGDTPSAVPESASALCRDLERVALAGRRRPTLSLCMTVCNEAATLEKAVGSVREFVDEVVIGVDRRSSDGTDAIARRLATRHFEYDETSPPDFPRMRNRALRLATSDWVLVLDGHEWIEGSERIRPLLAATPAWSVEVLTLFEPDERRVPGLSFVFPRLHRRHVRFTGAHAHEEVTTPHDRRETHREIRVWHERKPGVAARQRASDKQGRELDQLRAAWLERADRRALFYLANGLREAERYAEAIAAYEQYLRAPNFSEEAWQAALYLGRCHAACGAYPEAERIFESAVRSAPDRAEAVVALGYALLARGETGRAAAWFRMATALPEPDGYRLFIEVPVYRWGAWHGLALALHAAGDLPGAVAAERRARRRGAGGWADTNIRTWSERRLVS